MDFSGAKVAILQAGQVLTLLRDDTPAIPFPNHWDFPGGGREGAETPQDCVLRETFEEVSLELRPSDLVWDRAYGGVLDGQIRTWFFVARPPPQIVSGIRLGDEGQAWRWLPVPEFLALKTAVPHLRRRLRDYLAEAPPTA